MNNISKDLKKLQVMKKIPIISVHQQNRTSSDDGDFNTTQIAGSDRIGQDSTMVIFLEKKDDVMKLHLKKSRDSENNKVLTYHVERVKKAYPAYFGLYASFPKVRDYLYNIEYLYCIGRNGMHRYNNMDHSMKTAMVCVKNIINNISGKENIWNVNTDESYHEENDKK